MGMFDDLKCHYPLPNPAHQHRDFQTKSLECMMTQYTITKEGRLVEPEYEYVADKKAILGYHHVPTGRLIDNMYHGDIYFYDSPDAEYVARFTNGKVEWIVPLGEVEARIAAADLEPLPASGEDVAGLAADAERRYLEARVAALEAALRYIQHFTEYEISEWEHEDDLMVAPSVYVGNMRTLVEAAADALADGARGEGLGGAEQEG